MKVQHLFLFQVLAVTVVSMIKTVAFHFSIHTAVMENGLVSIPLIKVQPMEHYFALLMLEGNQTKLTAISKTLMEELLMHSLLLVF